MSADPELVDAVAGSLRRYRIAVGADEIRELARFLELIEHWNQKVSLTAIRDRPTAVLRHLVEPVMARVLLDGSGKNIVDAGSGMGVPGIPLAIVARDRDFTLVEANGKKSAFLGEVVDELKLTNVQVVNERLDTALETAMIPRPVHTVVSRAWTSGWAELLGMMAPVMAAGGRAIIFTGDETLRALRRQLAQGTELARQNVPEWRAAAAAGWIVRRAERMPHFEKGHIVTLELPSS